VQAKFGSLNYLPYLRDMILNKDTLKLASKNIGIYKITINDKEYIGSSCNIGSRLKHHLWSLENNIHHNRTMQNAWNKYGENNIFYEVVEICSEDDLIIREKYYIDTLNPYMNHILNPVNIVRDETYKQRLSEAAKRSYQEGREVVNKKTVYKYSLEGDYIESFTSLTDAGNPTAICACCNNRAYTAEGYRWSYERVDKLPTRKKKYLEKSVVQLCTDGIKELKVWDSKTIAERELGVTNIARAIKKGICAGGYKWQYEV
jgi:group I intron endonuclease